jgi:hypothetical protein
MQKLPTVANLIQYFQIVMYHDQNIQKSIYSIVKKKNSIQSWTKDLKRHLTKVAPSSTNKNLIIRWEFPQTASTKSLELTLYLVVKHCILSPRPGKRS